MPEAPRTLANLDLVAGNPALDFANTINSRVAPEHDYLGSFGDVVSWAERVGVAPPRARQVSHDPDATARALRQAQRLREAIYRSFSAVAAGEAPPPADVRRVLRAYGIAVGRASFGVGNADAGLRWPMSTRPSRVLDPIAYAAGELLLASDPPPVKECPGCGWLFLDRSRNGSRRWCDMQTCGSRDKMRRYYRTHRLRGT
jgi:predicted RNA-binding Zn ribbon-like protein